MSKIIAIVTSSTFISFSFYLFFSSSPGPHKLPLNVCVLN